KKSPRGHTRLAKAIGWVNRPREGRPRCGRPTGGGPHRRQVMASYYVPRAMRIAPRLDPDRQVPAVTPRLALLINPSHPKHAHALAVGDGVQLWPAILRDVEQGTLRPLYQADFRRPYREDPPPARAVLPRDSFLTTTSLIATRGCHNRCGFCYLSTEGLHMPYLVRDVEQIVAEFQAENQPYAVFVDNNLGSRPDYLRRLCRALRPLEKIWSAAV